MNQDKEQNMESINDISNELSRLKKIIAKNVSIYHENNNIDVKNETLKLLEEFYELKKYL